MSTPTELTQEQIDEADANARNGEAELPQEADGWTEPPELEAEALLRDERPKVQLPGDNHLLSDCADTIGRILATKAIFARGGLACTINERKDGLDLMTDETMRTWIEQYMVPFKLKKVGDAEQLIAFKRTISKTDAEGILASPQFIRHLRKIERLNPIRMPIMRGDGSIELLPEGYDTEAKAFTFNAAEFKTGMSSQEARAVINQLLGEFVFADSGRSKAVAVAAMLTVFASGLIPPGSLRPCFIYLANAEGAGKGLLAKCATVPVLGYAPIGTKPKDEDEMRKVLFTALLEAKPVILFDNVKGHLSSGALEGFLTAQHYEGRILGVSKSFLGENHTLVFATGNGCTVSPDLRRRSLFSELFLEAERAEDRVFKNNLEAGSLLAQRGEILAALWALIQEWDGAGRPKPTRGNSSFTDWSNIIGGIVEHAGFGCALETPEIESAADTDGTDMRALVKAIANGATMKVVRFDEITETARAGGLFTRIIPEEGDLDAKARATFAQILKRYDRRLLGGYRLTLIGKGRSRTFKIEEIRQ